MTVISNQPAWEVVSDILIIPVPNNTDVKFEFLTRLNEASSGLISRLQEQGELTGKSGESVTIYTTALSPNPFKCKKVILLGCGNSQKLTISDVEALVAPLFRKICEKPNLTVTIELSTLFHSQLQLSEVATGVSLQSVVAGADQGFYFTEKKRHSLAQLILCSFVSAVEQELQNAASQGEVIGKAVNLTRELVNRGPHDIYPETFAKRAEQLAGELGLRCEIWDKKKLESEKMGSLLGVAQGSSKLPYMVMLEYSGDPDSKEVLAWLEKGSPLTVVGFVLSQQMG